MSAISSLGAPDANGERRRFQVAVYLVVGVFFLLTLRLWFLQLIRGGYYRNLSENNRIRLEHISPTRGIIYDRYGRILVDNRPAFNLAVVPEDAGDLHRTLGELSRILGIEQPRLLEKVREAPAGAPFRPIVLKRDMSRDELARVASHQFHLPGVVVKIEPKRSYRRPRFAAHLIGYLGEIEEAQLKDERYQDCRLGDSLGKYGVEFQWEKALRGTRGGRQVEIDAAGRQLRILEEVSPRPGSNLVLTLDAELQRHAEQALAGKAGAIVALDPDNGDVLAMASSPAFDQNQFIRGFSPSQWQAVVDNPLRPLENKAIQGQYPPGSTFKPVVAAAALEEGLADPETTLPCLGAYRLGNHVYHCWRKRGHGRLNMHEALVQSCDIYFYQLGQRVGIDRMAKYARLFGLGSRTLMRLGNEARGLVPTAEWKLRRYGVPWQKGEDLVVAIGQGFVLVTPMQMALLYTAIGNGGKLLRPRLVQRVLDPRGRTTQVVEPEVRRELALRPETLAFLKKALAGVVQEPRGTGRGARLRGIAVAGKTGTAQVVRMSEEEDDAQDEEQVPYRFRDHAWFLAYAPADNPRIVVAVLVEHGGHGASGAAPLARTVMEEFFKNKLPSRMARQ
jgi:penicillin-binding protein 2